MTDFKVKPLFDRVIIKQDEAKTEMGGVIIPESSRQKPMSGVVMAVGNGKKDEPMTVKIGDHVLFGSFNGQEIEVDGNSYIMVREEEITVILGYI